MHSILKILYTIILLLISWYILCILTDVPKYILPAPTDVLKAFKYHYKLLFNNFLITLSEILIGYTFGTLIGIISGLQLIYYQTARNWLLPIMLFGQAIPIFALAPILTLWLGYGLLSKIVMTIIIIYFPITLSFYEGLKITSTQMLDLAQTMRASKNTILLYLRIPYALPQLASGLKLGAVFAPMGAVISEWIGASNGLGYLMLYANGKLQIDLLFASVILISLITISLYSSVSRILDYAIHWKKISFS